MNRLTLTQMQTLSPSRYHAPRMKSVAMALISSFNSGAMSNTVSLKSPASDSSLRSSARIKKTLRQVAAVAAPSLLSAAQRVMIHITIDASCVTHLRHLVIVTCGDLLEFMRIQPFAHATKMKVCLCLSKPAVDLIMDAVMRSLPSAEFGRITPA
jgi:hypothetical protein